MVANGVEYEVDCIIYASGFEITTEISRRYSIDAIEGRDGVSLFDHWRDGYKTLHGMTSRGFPNQFFTGFTQVGISANIAANYELQGEHIAYIISEALARGASTVEPSQAAQDEWVQDHPGDRDRQQPVQPGMHAGLLQQRRRRRVGGEGIRSHLGEPYGPGFYAFGDLLTAVARQGRPGWPRAGIVMAELRFDDRVAVVTGAGRGLGRAYALLLASRGARVVVNDNGGALTGDGADAGPAQQVVDRDHGGRRRRGRVRSSRWRRPRAARRSSQRRWTTTGGIDILVHNAGNVRRGSLKEMSYQDFDAVIDVHLRGAFHVVRPAFPLMCDAHYGRIVLTSSIGGLYGNHDVANYAAAKAGLIGLSNVVALEGAADGVLCNVIVPSAVTRMAEGLDISAYPPMGTELVAPVVGLLAHETCPVTGEMLIAIAGRVARAVIAETPGVQRPSWSIEDVAEQIDAIRYLAAATGLSGSSRRAWRPHPLQLRNRRTQPKVQPNGSSSKRAGPLAGVRVVDLTAMVMGPYCTQIMADMGADVIKVEPPQGDDTRYVSVGPVRGMSGVFVNVNRGKRSVVLDLQSESGKTVLRALIEQADVFIHSMRAKAIAQARIRL